MTRILPAWLIAAYHATTYRVTAADCQLNLRIGEANEDLRLLHERHDVSSSVFVTACNPFGEELSADDNALAMSRLFSVLERRSFIFISGQGCGDDATWPPEPSFLVLGIDLHRSLALCRLLRQNAVVFSGPECIPTLLMHPKVTAGA